jgi:nitrate reductase delta subunit
MQATECELCLYEAFGQALAYPDAQLAARLSRLEAALEDACPAARTRLHRLRVALAGLSPEAVEEHYTWGFDLAPQAVPYLGVALFGAESPQRAQFMAGLRARYEATGHDAGNELPDHLAVVLRFATKATAEEWGDIVGCCLAMPLRHMRLGLEKAGNPYAHLLAALEAVVAGEDSGDSRHD